MSSHGFTSADLENMQCIGTKMLLTATDGTSNIVSIVGFDDLTQRVSVQYDRNEFMAQHLLDKLREDVFEIDLRVSEHQWIDSERDLYCLSCHSLDMDNLFVCNHESHQLNGEQVAFHDRCLDVSLGHSIPNNNICASWICPMHKNLLQMIDPNSLRKRRGDYDFEFDRATKRRKITIFDPKWLGFDEESEPVFPRHIECDFCVKAKEECDGNRPCSNCCKFVEHEVLDLNEPKYLRMNEEDLQNEIDENAAKICKDRRCSLAEFESDFSMRQWLKVHDTKNYQSLMQKQRENEQQNEIEIENESDCGDEQLEMKEIENENEVSAIHFVVKESEFRSFVPIDARYECAECHKLFGDKYRFKMHSLWAHQSVVCSKKAQNEKWHILNHFECDKPLKFACPYAGCLRGANSKNEIEAHILRHHDISDPTKPKIKKKEKRKNEKKIEKKSAFVIECKEKDKMTKIWNEANESQIDRINQRDLVKHFVASMLSDNLDKFDQTTKRLQRRYRALSESGAVEQQSGDLIELPPMLGNDEYSKQEQAKNDGPRSMWQ